MGEQHPSGRRVGKSAWLDPARREVLAYCVDHGIPPSEFRTRWSEDDQDEVLGFLAEKRAFEAEICQSCGTRQQDWDRAKAEGNPAYMIETSVCPGCRELERHRIGHADDSPAAKAGQKVLLVPFEVFTEAHPDGVEDDE